MMTFSFKPLSLSIFPWIAASVSTFVVSWNEAAETHDSVPKDAFVIPLTGNKSVSADRAAILEKEWGKKPFITAEPVTHADTVTPTLTFRVEVTRSVKPLKEDVVDGIRKVAGNRGLDILILEDGKTGYVIGKFITFETAAEYSDLLKRNGYKDAQVVAWLGKKQIPIDTARQLVDKLK